MSKRRIVVVVLAAAFLLGGALEAQVLRARRNIRVPDVPGYRTLKCDFHIHTVFSDGAVWPTVRAEEAWRNGLDVLAITDHLEYQPHKTDLPTNHNRSYDIARPLGESLDILMIRGSEVTRKMPPGHLNAIFLQSSEPLAVEDWRQALQAARDQGAFIFWNHPAWTGQQPDGLMRVYPEHTELLGKGFIQGVEVVNDQSYYPDVHRWCLENNLTMLGNSDMHDPVGMAWALEGSNRRPVTLVFAREATQEAVKEALVARRTAVLAQGMLIGREAQVKPVFEASIKVLNPSVRIQGKQAVNVQIENLSDVDYELVADGGLEEVSVPSRLTLKGGCTVIMQLRGKSDTLEGRRTLAVPYVVQNIKVTPDEGLKVRIPLEVALAPAKK